MVVLVETLIALKDLVDLLTLQITPNQLYKKTYNIYIHIRKYIINFRFEEWYMVYSNSSAEFVCLCV